EKARELLESVHQEQRNKTAAMNAVGIINPLLPEESRPALSLEERMAMANYAGGRYKKINPPLWNDGIPDPPHDEMHRLIQEAFKKTKPFPRPVRVARGLKFKDPAKLDAYLKPFQDAAGTDNLIPLKGYISTGTVGTPAEFVGNVEFNIIAKQG